MVLVVSYRVSFNGVFNEFAIQFYLKRCVLPLMNLNYDTDFCPQRKKKKVKTVFSLLTDPTAPVM